VLLNISAVYISHLQVGLRSQRGQKRRVLNCQWCEIV